MSSSYRCTSYWTASNLGLVKGFLCFVCFTNLGPVCLYCVFFAFWCLYYMYYYVRYYLYSVRQKSIKYPLKMFAFFGQPFGILSQNFTHWLRVHTCVQRPSCISYSLTGVEEFCSWNCLAFSVCFCFHVATAILYFFICILSYCFMSDKWRNGITAGHTPEKKSRLHLHFSNRHQLVIPRCQLNTYGHRTFSVASLTVRNSLPAFGFDSF